MPLPADPTRQAVDAWRGYYYQLLHTIHAWLELPEGTVLYLEGAEDFDVIGPEEATAVQVKDTSENITLRSRSVTATITHFWQVRKASPHRKVLFTLLTRSKITVESGEPFGPNVAGLELWERCAKGTCDYGALFRFLRDEERLPEDLRQFIASTDPASVIEELIRPIAWQTQSQGGGFVEEAIKRKLEFHGDKFGVPPSEAIRVLNRLLKEAFERVCRPSETDRMLDRTLFLRLFEEETRNVPAHQVQLLTQLASQLLPALLPSGSSVVGGTLTTLPLISSEIPPPTQHIHRRQRLITELLQRLEASGVLILTGSSGTGKTTLAKLIGQEIHQQWFWLSLSGRELDYVNASLRQVGAFLDAYPERHSLIIDGLDLDAAHLKLCEEQLGGVLHTLFSRRGRVILTTARPLPDRVLRQFAIGSSSIRIVPPFTEEDIAAFATSLGCPDPKLAKQWATAIALHTGGHPQLVHARLHRLAQLQWPPMQPDDLFCLPSDVVNEQSQARQLLSHADDDQCDLLYRLSLISGSFRRDHAIAIAESQPPVTHPGDVFDQLVGPWIELAGSDRYRLSPLLSGAATQVWSAQRVESLHATVGRALMSCPPISTVDVTTALLHAWKGRDYGVLVGIIYKIVFSKRDLWKALAHELGWLVGVGLMPKRAPISENPVANCAFRMLQFRVAAELNLPVAADVADAWEMEVVPLAPEELYLSLRFMFAVDVIFHYEVAVSANWLIARFREAVELHKRLDLHLSIPSVLPSWMTVENQEIDLVTTLFSFVWLRCTGHRYLEEFLDALQETPAPIRDRLLSSMRRNEFLAALLVDRVYLKEYQSTEPNWDACIRVLQQAVTLGAEWHVDALTAAAARTLAVIHDECRGDHTQALAVLDSVEAQIGTRSPLLRDERANILYRRDEYNAALSIWEAVLPSWLPPRDSEDISPLFAYRKAGIAAAKTRDWSRAASLFGHAADRSCDLGQDDWVIGFKADAAYALWRSGKRHQSITTFGDTLRLMASLPDPRTNLTSFALRKYVGHIVLWIKDTATDGVAAGTPEPPPGLCSNHERSEKLRDLPLPSLDMIWALLLEAEYESQDRRTLLDAERPRLVQSRLPVVRVLLARLAVRHALKALELTGLPTLLRDLGIASADLQAQHESGSELWDEPRERQASHDFRMIDRTLDIQAFAAALAGLVACQRFDVTVFSDWRQDANGLRENEVMLESITLAQTVMSLEPHEAIGVMKDGNRPWGDRLIASVRVLATSDVAPDELFLSHALLVLGLGRGLWASEVTPYLLQIMESQWLARCAFPATLRAPRISIPSIRAACASDSVGPKKAAQILLAASVAVSVRLSKESVANLRNLAAMQ